MFESNKLELIEIDMLNPRFIDSNISEEEKNLLLHTKQKYLILDREELKVIHENVKDLKPNYDDEQNRDLTYDIIIYNHSESNWYDLIFMIYADECGRFTETRDTEGKKPIFGGSDIWDVTISQFAGKPISKPLDRIYGKLKNLKPNTVYHINYTWELKLMFDPSEMRSQMSLGLFKEDCEFDVITNIYVKAFVTQKPDLASFKTRVYPIAFK